jgi:hypothetical protein
MYELLLKSIGHAGGLTGVVVLEKAGLEGIYKVYHTAGFKA